MGSVNPLMQHIATRNMSSDLSKNAKPQTSGVRGMLPANSVSLGNGGDLQWLHVLSSPVLFKPATSVVERARQPLREDLYKSKISHRGRAFGNSELPTQRVLHVLSQVGRKVGPEAIRRDVKKLS